MGRGDQKYTKFLPTWFIDDPFLSKKVQGDCDKEQLWKNRIGRPPTFKNNLEIIDAIIR